MMDHNSDMNIFDRINKTNRIYGINSMTILLDLIIIFIL